LPRPFAAVPDVGAPLAAPLSRHARCRGAACRAPFAATPDVGAVREPPNFASVRRAVREPPPTSGRPSRPINHAPSPCGQTCRAPAPALPTVRCSLFTIHCPLPTAHCSLLTVNCPLFIVHCSLFIANCSLFIVHCARSRPNPNDEGSGSGRRKSHGLLYDRLSRRDFEDCARGHAYNPAGQTPAPNHETGGTSVRTKSPKNAASIVLRARTSPIPQTPLDGNHQLVY